MNYRGEVLIPPFSFMSAESVAQSENIDFEKVSFRDPGFGFFTQSFRCLTGT